MTKYFFDLVGQGCAQYDYQGRIFSVPEQAFRLAELMALDLEMNGDGEWSGWSVEAPMASNISRCRCAQPRWRPRKAVRFA